MTNQTTSINNTQKQQLDRQVNLYLFDLQNEAKEHGFKENESWILEIANKKDLATLRRSHYPLVTLKLEPSILLKVYQQVKEKLQQELNATDEALTETELVSNEKGFLVAYPLRNVRK